MYARKVALLQVLKYMPASIELANAIAVSNASEDGKGVVLEGDFVHSPRNDDAGLEPAIAAISTAPRVTPADIEESIACEVSFVVGNVLKDCPVHESLNLLTICVLTLKNGFTVTGESACASPENFNAEIGRRIARENATQKIWPLMGYALKDRLHSAALLD
jgi:hypothetical protein